jgi:quinoprotein glucose dehydrogenase
MQMTALPKCAVLTLVALATVADASSPDEGWPAYGGAPGAPNFSALSDINTTNVTQLRLAWQWQTGETALKEFGTSPGMFETTPIVIDGVMYLSTPYNRVVALDPGTGRQLWSYDPRAYVDGQPPNGTGFVHRGVAAWRDPRTHALRIVIASRYRLIELDARSGKPVAGFGHEGVVNLHEDLQWPVNPRHYTNTSPPLVYRNLIIVGNGVADRLIYRRDPPGDVRAYDARSGRRVWSFHTVPRDGEFGADTWGMHSNCPWERRAMTSTAAIDPATTCTPIPLSVWMPTPASAAGIASSCTMGCGTTTRRLRPRWCRSSRPVRRSMRSCS